MAYTVTHRFIEFLGEIRASAPQFTLHSQNRTTHDEAGGNRSPLGSQGMFIQRYYTKFKLGAAGLKKK